MNYLINPIWLYLISLVDDINGVVIVAMVITVIAAFVVVIWTDDTSVFESPQEEIIALKKKIKKFAVLFVIELLILIFIPSKSDMEKMLIASYATEDNITAATNYGKDLVDYIFDKVNGADKEEEKK